MTRKLHRTEIAGLARIVALEAPTVDHPPRSFEMPTRLYGLTIAAYLAFLVVTAVGFASAGLTVPIAICAVYIAMAFGTPALWARIRPEGAGRALSWAEFRRSGIATATGHCDATSATLQVLVLPVMVLLWGIVTAVLYAVLT
jgi:hypothetical protein